MIDVKTLLKSSIQRQTEQNKSTKDENLNLEQELYEKYLGDNGVSLKEEILPIPRFHHRLPKEDEPLRQKLREETRSNFLQRRSRHLLDNAELKSLWTLLDRHQTAPEEQLISYSDFKKVVALAGPKVQHYFTATVFAKLQQGDPQGKVSIMSLFNYIMRKVWMEQTRIGLSLYDTSGQGYLREGDLESYITELIPTLPQLEGLEKSFHSFYVCTAVRKFLFFLDTLRAGRVRILDVLACSFLDDLLELRVEEASKEIQEQNWFSARSALRVYGHYLNLDRDHNGLLNINELAGYGTGTLTQPFLERVFQTCLTYNGEMDYKTYLDVVLALENRSEPQALAYLFRILDLNNQSYLNAFSLNYFFRAIEDQLKQQGAEPVRFEDFKDELFDMVKPKDPLKITLNDILSCGKGETFVSILIEFQAFWSYESRESVSSDPSQD
ncbi:serine/threonine-protein phosphatase 2A regulatory subunit B'' subunit gamma-like [Atheta coriaria]|uniref:serine/threonine-protein phosphatase 2A regulatory subunit B'' subunit gamma-like n=1 Tax=Dalotia coriaria TaxID=877792 RepID=UPI0031F46F92